MEIIYQVIVSRDKTLWKLNDKLHREDDLPAVEYKNGDRIWYKDGQRHRDGDLPAVEYIDGYRAWYKNNKLHRYNKPAVEYPYGYKEWYNNGKYHNYNGPAIEHPDGGKEWYLNGIKVTEEEHARLTSKVKELTAVQLEELLGYPIKIIK